MAAAPPTPGKLFAAKLEAALVLAGSCDASPESPLYHYTTSTGLQGILRERRLRATHFGHLNDSGELVEGEKLVHAVARDLSERRGLGDSQQGLCRLFVENYGRLSLTNVADVFVASLTEAGNDLSHWRAYGGQGGGYCIGVRLPDYRRITGKPGAALGISLEKVVYDASDMRSRIETSFRAILDKFAEFMDQAPDDADHRNQLARTGARGLLEQAGMLVTRYKAGVFAVEQEWRIVAITPRKPLPGTIQFHTRPTGLAPYVNVDLFLEEADPLELASVHVGPTLDADRGVHAARLLLTEVGHDPELVLPSGIPLRW